MLIRVTEQAREQGRLLGIDFVEELDLYSCAGCGDDCFAPAGLEFDDPSILCSACLEEPA